jgi:Protein of unknown function (DUF3253)
VGGERCVVSEKRDASIEEVILRLLEVRGEGKTICPSEAARAVAGSKERAVWEPLMEVVRAVAERMVGDGKIVVTQKGRVVDGGTAKGAVRFRLR